MIYLIRQGETDWNLLKRFNGCTETDLTQTGIMQAKQLAEALQNVQLDLCFCSPQRRAVQTCEIVCKKNIKLDDRLIEINCGEFEGTQENAESMKAFWQAVMKGDKGTERFKDFLNRNCDFCEMISNEYKGKNILIITHAANVRVIDYYFKGKPKDYDFRKSPVQPGQVVTYENL